MAHLDLLANKEEPNRVALILKNGEQVTYNTLSADVDKLSLYCKKRSLAFCFCDNNYGSLVGYVSFLSNSVVPLMLDSSMNEQLATDLIDLYKPDYLWKPSAFLAEQERLKVVFEAYQYALVQHSEDAIPMHPELALLLTTSGSTGSPKLVRLTYENILSNAQSIIEYLHIGCQEKAVTSLPMHYSFGLSVINTHLLTGATLLLTNDSIAQREFWNFVKSYDATSFSGVPYTYELLKRLRVMDMDLPCLQTFTQAGGKLHADTVLEYVQKAKLTNRRFIVMYGQTEATARMSYLPFEVAEEKSSSIGIAIPGGEFKLIDEVGNEILIPNMEGELIYMGKNVGLGYAENCIDLVHEDTNHGILHTGDIAKKDIEGYYYITGRMKRFVKIFGNRINLDAIEQSLKSVCSDCACVGTDERILIYITEQNLKETVLNHLLERIKVHPSVISVRVIDELPKNSSGKIQYSQLQYN